MSRDIFRKPGQIAPGPRTVAVLLGAFRGFLFAVLLLTWCGSCAPSQPVERGLCPSGQCGR
jgi:hypothetical protein